MLRDSDGHFSSDFPVDRMEGLRGNADLQAFPCGHLSHLKAVSTADIEFRQKT